MDIQVPDLGSMRQQQPSVPLFMLKSEMLKCAVEALPHVDDTNVLALADKFLLYIMSPSIPEAHDEAPASLIEDF